MVVSVALAPESQLMKYSFSFRTITSSFSSFQVTSYFLSFHISVSFQIVVRLAISCDENLVIMNISNSSS